jgi:hypothetical protein
MKKNLVYLVCAFALLASCSPAYKTSQTPDDVYYSPGKKIITADNYEIYTSSDDAYLRMKVKDHNKWSGIDDYDYWYDSRYYATNYSSPWTSYVSLGLGYSTYYPYYSYSPYGYNPWQSWYSPSYTVVYYKNPSVYYKPVSSRYTLSTYTNKNYNNYNMPLQSHSRSSMYNNSNSTHKTNNSYNNQNYNSNSSRSFNSGSSGMSSGGSRISGGGGRTRP